MKKTLTTLALLAGISAVAFAQSAAFEEVDVNQDGIITVEEAATIEGLDFGAADLNGDGMLDKAEYEAAMR